MNITLNQVRIFKAAAEQQSITAAAAQLCMTQPAVSIQLKQLEERLGQPLFEIIGKQFHLTEAGKLLLKTAIELETSLTFLYEELLSLKGGLSGTLKIGAATSAQYFLPKLLGLFHAQYSGIALRLKIRNRAEVLQRLFSNQDDLCVVSQLPQHEGICYQQILDDELILVAPPDFNAQEINQLSKLGNFPFIIREQGSGTRMAIERFFAAHNFEPKIVMELGSAEAIIEAIYAGIGGSILPKSVLRLPLQAKYLQVLPLKELPLPHPWYVLYLKDKRLSAVVKNFLTRIGVKLN